MAWYVFSLSFFSPAFLEFVLLTVILVPATNREAHLQPQQTHKFTHTHAHINKNRLQDRVLPPTERPRLLAPPSDNLFHNRGFDSGSGSVPPPKDLSFLPALRITVEHSRYGRPQIVLTTVSRAVRRRGNVRIAANIRALLKR